MTLPSEVDNTGYMNYIRHWHAESEAWAGADCLLTAIDNGWTVDNTVYVEEFWRAGSRPVTVYDFKLTRGDEAMVMPVITNPFTRRLLRMLAMKQRPANEQDEQLRRLRQLRSSR